MCGSMQYFLSGLAAMPFATGKANISDCNAHCSSIDTSWPDTDTGQDIRIQYKYREMMACDMCGLLE